MSTDYHAKYFAHELTRRYSSEKLGKLSQSLLNATVDLNPHQIDAALFAFQSPLSRGAILADEVGLGKTIEAGLVISQLWAERKRRILCILPAVLRKQWQRECIEKFFIDSAILEAKAYNQLVRQGVANPFEHPGKLVICSYQFARSKDQDVRQIPWDLVVIDESHRLRNVYKKSNKIARAIREAIGHRPKILLTATPLQNSLMELFGLVSFIDPHIFGSEDSFREQFSKRSSDMTDAEFERLRARIRSICQRTLRRQVTEYIRYTNRVSIAQDFTPTPEEVSLYDAVSSYLQRPESFALPPGQRSLMTLVLRKILASSSFAIAATLGTLVDRLDAKHAAIGGDDDLAETIAEDFDAVDELQDEWSEQENEQPAAAPEGTIPEQQKAAILRAIRKEVDELRSYKTLAESITSNAKGEALLIALKTGFEKAATLGAPRKALIFTESRRTQHYLKELLDKNGYAGHVVRLSGTNSDPDSRAIYQSWLQRHRDDDIVTGSASVDVRSALVDEFRDRESILVATEAGAEGLNLQFCSLVVNYDLPWNPQRIEQRIGRCHRYGQQHDVVVINFLNRRNAADQRVFELLSEKLRLFDGIFGSSDEVLGALGSGVDFEKRVHEIYQSCRTPGEINAAFDRLQAELEEQIRAQMADTRTRLLENFDEEVHARLRVSRDETAQQLDRFGNWLWRLTEYELGACAEFSHTDYSFELRKRPEELDAADIPLGRYRFVTQRTNGSDHHYRLGHPLAEHVIARAKSRQLPPTELLFRYNQHPAKISVIEKLRGRAGWLRIAMFAIESLEREEHLVLVGLLDDGAPIDGETCARLFAVAGEAGQSVAVEPALNDRLNELLMMDRQRIVADVTNRNRGYFDAEMEKLETWADDLKQNLEQELKELDKEVKAVKKEARQATDLDSKVALHKRAKELERKRTERRRSLFEAQDEIDSRKESLIGAVETRLKQRLEISELFTIRWKVQ